MSMCIALVPFVSHVALIHILCFVMGLINTFIFIGRQFLLHVQDMCSQTGNLCTCPEYV